MQGLCGSCGHILTHCPVSFLNKSILFGILITVTVGGGGGGSEMVGMENWSSSYANLFERSIIISCLRFLCSMIAWISVLGNNLVLNLLELNGRGNGIGLTFKVETCLTGGLINTSSSRRGWGLQCRWRWIPRQVCRIPTFLFIMSLFPIKYFFLFHSIIWSCFVVFPWENLDCLMPPHFLSFLLDRILRGYVVQSHSWSCTSTSVIRPKVTVDHVCPPQWSDLKVTVVHVCPPQWSELKSQLIMYVHLSDHT